MRAVPLGLRDGDRQRLESWVRSSTVAAGLSQRAWIVLLAADGLSNTEIAELVGASRSTVIGWQRRYRDGGMDALFDQARSGRPRTVDHRRIVAATLQSPPRKLGVTHWSSRLLAKHLKIGDATVARAWREYGVAPLRYGTFKFSTDPHLIAQVTDVVGLYLAPPENAIVLCCGQASEIRDPDQTAPVLPMQPRLPQFGTHDWTLMLSAALNIATDNATAIRQPRHRHREFLRFLTLVARGYPDDELHLMMDNYAANERIEIRDWLAANPRVHVHFTPTSALWMKLIEVWFEITERQALHRVSFRSARDVTTSIGAFISGWNDRCHPFVWCRFDDPAGTYTL